MLKNVLIVAIVAVLVLGGAVAGYRYWWSGDGNLASDRAGSKTAKSANKKKTEAPPLVHALGRIEPEGGLIDVGGMAGDQLESLIVKEEQKVKAGAELGYLASHALRQAEKEAAEAQLAEAEKRQAADEVYGKAQLDESELALKQLEVDKLDVEAQKAKEQLLASNLKLAKKDYERLDGLDDSIISRQERDHQDMRVEQAEAEYESGAKQLAKMEGGLALNKDLAQAKKQTAEAALKRIESASVLTTLRKNVDLADKRLKTTVISAPIDGVILKIVTRPGENIGQKPVLQIGNTDKMTVVAEVFENDIQWVKKGQKATCKSDALSKDLGGKVVRIGATVAKGAVSTLDPTASNDTRVVDVIIELDGDPSNEAAGLINLQVDVEIITNSTPAAP